MTLQGFTHLALRVERLHDAEALYAELFSLSVAFRETETPDGWLTIRPEADWDAVEKADINVGLVMLYRDGLRLALEAVGHVSREGLLSHVGVQADAHELDPLRERALAAGCEIVADQHGRALIFDDPLGVRWEVNTFAYDDPASLSTGARTGAWLNVP